MDGKWQKQRTSTQGKGLETKESSESLFLTLYLNLDFYVRNFFQLSISEGVRTGKEVAAATNSLLFILFVEISLFCRTEHQIYEDSSSVGYLMLGTHEPRSQYLEKKILPDSDIALAITHGLGNTS